MFSRRIVCDKKSAQSILDKALGVVPTKTVETSRGVGLRRSEGSKFSLKHFIRDDSMFGAPDSIRANVDREISNRRSKDKKGRVEKYVEKLAAATQQQQQQEKQPRSQSVVTPMERKDWILRDDLDEEFEKIDWDRVPNQWPRRPQPPPVRP